MRKIMFGLSKLTNEELGTVYLELETCGKPNCRCARGKLHRSYYHYYRKTDMYSNSKLLRKYVKKSDVRRLRARLQYQKNKNDVFDIDMEWVAYSGENVSQMSIPQLVKRIHVIRNKGIRNKKTIEENAARQMYGDNYLKGMEIEKKLFQIDDKSLENKIDNKEKLKLMMQLNYLMCSPTKKNLYIVRQMS